MSPLDLIPASLGARIALLAGGVVVAFGAGVATGWASNGWRLGEQIALAEATQKQAIIDAVKKETDTYVGIVHGLAGVAHEAQQKSSQGQADAVAAGVAAAGAADTAGRMYRLAQDTYRGHATCSTAAAGTSEAAEAASVVHSNLLQRLAENARETERTGREAAVGLDSAYLAGVTCVDADAVMQRRK